MWYIPIFLLGAYAYHLRGSAGGGGRLQQLLGEAPGTQVGRLIWAATVTFVLTACTGNMWMMAFIPIPAFLGVLPGYWTGEFDLAKEKNRNPKNYAILSLRGAWIAFPVMLVLIAMREMGLHNGDIGGFGVIAGGMFHIWYLLGRSAYNLGFRLPLVVAWPEWAQFILGGAVMVGVGVSL